MIELPFEEAKKYLENGDVLLLSPSGVIGNVIAGYGEGGYSHAGIFFWEDGKGFITEFKEFHGGRTISLDKARRDYLGRMHFFRATPYTVELEPSYVDGAFHVKKILKHMNGKLTANYIKKLEGVPYGWRRILILAKRKLPFLRLFLKSSRDDRQTNGHIYPVCSTAVAKAFRETYTDLIPQKSDLDVEPSDLARSKVLYHMFRITD